MVARTQKSQNFSVTWSHYSSILSMPNIKFVTDEMIRLMFLTAEMRSSFKHWENFLWKNMKDRIHGKLKRVASGINVERWTFNVEIVLNSHCKLAFLVTQNATLTCNFADCMHYTTGRSTRRISGEKRVTYHFEMKPFSWIGDFFDWNISL